MYNSLCETSKIDYVTCYLYLAPLGKNIVWGGGDKITVFLCCNLSKEYTGMSSVCQLTDNYLISNV